MSVRYRHVRAVVIKDRNQNYEVSLSDEKHMFNLMSTRSPSSFTDIKLSLRFSPLDEISKFWFQYLHIPNAWVVGSGDGAGKLPVPGRPTALAYSRAKACCACSKCWMGGPVFFFFFFFFFFSSRLSYLSFSNASSLGRRLDMTEILWSRPL